MDKLAYSVDEAVSLGAGSRSEIYNALKDGRLRAKKRGRSTLLLKADLEAYLASLPDYDQCDATSAPGQYRRPA